MRHSPTLIKERLLRFVNTKPKAGERARTYNYWTEFFSYLFPVMWGVPMMLMGANFGLLHDYSWYVALVAEVPEMPAVVVYGNVLSCLSAGIGSFAVTLRDRNLLSKRGEALLVSLSSTAILTLVLGMAVRYEGVDRLVSQLLLGLA